MEYESLSARTEVILDGTIKSRAGTERMQSWMGQLKVVLVQNGSNLGWDSRQLKVMLVQNGNNLRWDNEKSC